MELSEFALQFKNKFEETLLNHNELLGTQLIHARCYNSQVRSVPNEFQFNNGLVEVILRGINMFLICSSYIFVFK